MSCERQFGYAQMVTESQSLGKVDEVYVPCILFSSLQIFAGNGADRALHNTVPRVPLVAQ